MYIGSLIDTWCIYTRFIWKLIDTLYTSYISLYITLQTDHGSILHQALQTAAPTPCQLPLCPLCPLRLLRPPHPRRLCRSRRQRPQRPQSKCRPCRRQRNQRGTEKWWFHVIYIGLMILVLKHDYFCGTQFRICLVTIEAKPLICCKSASLS